MARKPQKKNVDFFFKCVAVTNFEEFALALKLALHISKAKLHSN